MNPTLEELRVRIRAYLMDVAGLVWDDSVLDEAVRLAVADLQRISPITLTIEGLDGELVTVLEMDMDGMIVRGGAVYAMEARCIDRADSYEIEPTVSDIGNLVERIKKQYLIDIEKLRTRQFQVSSGVPYFQLPDPDEV